MTGSIPHILLDVLIVGGGVGRTLEKMMTEIINVKHQEYLEDKVFEWGDDFVHITRSGGLTFVIWPDNQMTFESVETLDELQPIAAAKGWFLELYFYTYDELNYYAAVEKL